MSTLTEAQAIILCDAFVDSLDADAPGSPGYMVCYDGTPPANVEAALSSNDPVVTIVFDATEAFQDAAVGGSGARAAITGTPSGASAKASDISFARLFRGNGTKKAQLSVSLAAGSGEVKFSTLTSSVIGQTFTCATLYWDQPLTNA